MLFLISGERLDAAAQHLSHPNADKDHGVDTAEEDVAPAAGGDIQRKGGGGAVHCIRTDGKQTHRRPRVIHQEGQCLSHDALAVQAIGIITLDQGGEERHNLTHH